MSGKLDVMGSDTLRPPPVGAQPSLFGDLPRTEAGGPTARRARAMVRRGERKPPTPLPVSGDEVPGDGGATAAAPAAAAASITTIVVETVPAPFDPAALSQAELRSMVSALPDHKLTFLLTEAARELKRRIMPDAAADPTDPDSAPAQPDPGLLRAAQSVMGELSGEDDFGGGYGGGGFDAAAARKSAAARGRTPTRSRHSA